MQAEQSTFAMEEALLEPKDPTNSKKDCLETQDGASKHASKPQDMDDKHDGSCSEEHTSDADTDDKPFDENSIDLYERRKKRKVLRKRKRPQKRSSNSNSTTTTTTTMTSAASDVASKDTTTSKACANESLELFAADNSTLTQASEADKCAEAESTDQKVVVDTLDRVKQEANAMDQPAVGAAADQQVPSALLAKRAEKSASASGSGTSKYVAAMARHEVNVQSGESSHDEDDSDIVGVAGGEGASTVTSELGMFSFFCLLLILFQSSL